MPFLNLEWTSNRIQFFGEVDLFSVLSGLLYRNEWSSISGILTIVVGYKIAGVLGIIVSVIATILPPFIIISIVSVFYTIFKENLIVHYILDGMQSGVGAVIGVVVVEMALGIFKEKNIGYYLIMFGAFIANYFFDVNVVLIILTCIVIGIIYSLYERRLQQ